MDDIFKNIHDSLIAGDLQKIQELVKKALEKKIQVKQILDKGLLKGMEIIGKDFKENKIFIPEVLISAKAVHAGLALLKPYFKEEGLEPKGKIIIGTVKGDLHDIGKNLVSMMLSGAGFEVFDLGVDVPKEKFLEQIKSQDSCIIVGMSCLISTALNSIKETIDYLKVNCPQGNIKIMVGGAALTGDFAVSAGADKYGKSAADSVDIANTLIKELK